MARDRQLPGFLGRVSVKRAVPANAIVFVSVLSAGLGLYMATRPDGIALLAGMINFGAMVAFLLLHLSVIVHYLFRKRSLNLWSHLAVPLAGMVILVFVIINASIRAQTVGLIWIGVGVVWLAALFILGRRPTQQTLHAAAVLEGSRA
jgi:amino acid transporter